MVTKLYINNERLDLFQDENIEVKSAITDAQDISKNVGDYSKSFTVPASDNNNRIFKHYYDADIDNTFDARIKVSGRIELDGIPFKVGKWRLTKVSVKKNKPSAYTINFFGNLVSLKDKFKKDELSDLDFSAFDHDFDSTNVKLGLQSSLFSGSIIYNLLAKKQYYYNSDSTDATNTTSLSNIAFNGQQVGVDWIDLRPSIKLIDIIEAIETDYAISFSRDFFGRSEFDNLYLWINKDKDKNAGGGQVEVEWDAGSNEFINYPTTNTGVYYINNSPNLDTRRHFDFKFNVTPQAGFETVDYEIVLEIDGEEEMVSAQRGNGFASFWLNYETEGTYELKWYIRSNEGFSFVCFVQQDLIISTSSGNTATAYFTNQNAVNTIDSVFEVSSNMPKIKIIDFLKGIFSAFKLVVIPLNEESIYVNTINSYYADGSLYDITQYVDFESYDVERGNIFNEINFNFQEPQSILNKQFENNTGLAYGDEELQLADADGEPLDGDTLEVKLPFEQVVYERLRDLEDSSETNIQYGAIINEELEPTNIKPHIFYNIQQSIGSKTIGFINDLNVVEELTGNINTASHTFDFESMPFSFVWSQEFNTWDGQAINNTLYKNYYEDYVLSIFNIKRRNFKFNANLPLNILTGLELNDVLKIKERYYRVDNYTINLLTGDTKLELINSFDNDLSSFGVSPTTYFIDSNSQRLTSNVTGTDDYDVSKINQGYGVAWYTVSKSGQNVVIDVDANNSGVIRTGQVQVLDKINIEFKYILITQRSGGSTLDFSNEYNSDLINLITVKS